VRRRSKANPGASRGELVVGESENGDALGQAVVRVTDQHLEALVDFIRKVWDPNATVDNVRRARACTARANPVTPGEPPPTFLFLAAGKPVGHLSTIADRVWAGSAEIPVHWMKGLMVLPEHRRGPVGFFLLKAALQHSENAMAMVVDPRARRLFEALGFRDVGVLPNYIRILRPIRVLRAVNLDQLGLDGLSRPLRAAFDLASRRFVAPIAGTTVEAATRLWCAAAGGASTRARFETLESWGEGTRADFDALWQRVRPALGAAAVRDGARFAARNVDSRYKIIRVERDGRTVAGAAVRRPRETGDARLGGIRVAVLSDLLLLPEDRADGLSAIRSAETVARELEADALLCSCSHPCLQGLLKRRGYLRLPGNVHFLTRLALPSERMTELSRWWLLRRDGRADDAF